MEEQTIYLEIQTTDDTSYKHDKLRQYVQNEL